MRYKFRKLSHWIIPLITALLFTAKLYSQEGVIPELKANISKATTPTSKLKAILSLCNEWDSFSPDSLYKYALMGEETANALNDESAKRLCNFYFSAYYFQKGKQDTALQLVQKSLSGLEYNQLNKDDYLKFFRLRGNIYIRKAMFDESIKANFDLLNQAEKNKDSACAGLACTGLGNINNLQQKKQEALSWYLKAQGWFQNIELRQRFSFLFNNLAIVYYKLGKEDSMYYYIDKGIEYSKNGTLTDYTNSLSLKGGMLAEYGKTAEAELYLKQALEARKKIGDLYFIVSDMAQLGLFYLNSKEYQKGIDICKEGVRMIEENKFRFISTDIYQSLARNYKAAGQYEKAEETLETILRIKDSVNERNSNDLMEELQTKYEVQKKENTIVQQKFNLTKKNYYIYGTVGLLIATLLFGYLFMRNRRKTQQLKMKQLEAEQKNTTTQAVMQAEEEERKRIAGELHDSVAQKMVVAKMNLEVLGTELNNLSESQQKIYTNIISLLSESSSEVRQLSHSMMPQAFEHMGLVNAVRDFLDKINKNSLVVNFSAGGELDKIRERKALMIFRIIQEAVQNVLKHAKADKLDLTMNLNKNELEVIIEDNGLGLDISQLKEKGMGITNIYSRIDYLNGKIEINSHPGKGTLMAFKIPVQNT